MAGLPKFTDVFKQPLQSDEPRSRQLTVPTNLNKIEIIATDGVYNPKTTRVLINPETITEQKSANWVRHNIPGQSDPLLQWISGSERTVSFSVLITLDTADNPTTTSSNQRRDIAISESSPSDSTGGFEFTGSSIPVYEGALLGALSGQAGIELGNVSRSTVQWAISIQQYLDYYRSLIIPRTSNRRNKLKPPPLVQLKMGTLLGNSSITESLRWFLAGYTFNITKYTPDLRPIEAIVNLTFIEYRDRSQFIDEAEVKNRIFQGQLEAQKESTGRQIRQKNTTLIDLSGGIGGTQS